MRFFPCLLLLACTETKAVPDVGAAPSSAPSIATAAPVTPSASPTTSGSAQAPDSVAVQHVLVAYKGAKGAPKTVTRTKDQAKALADDVAKRARAGEDFAELAKTYSDDPGSKDRLGSLGKKKREDLVPPFADAAFALKIDEISNPVETPFGFHVIKRNQ